MNDQNDKPSLEKLSKMSVEKAADALMQMTPREAGAALDNMDEERYFLIQKQIFEKNFKFHGAMTAEAFANALNSAK